MEVELQQMVAGRAKGRHGCLTAYLIALMTLSMLGAATDLLMSEQALMLNDPELPAAIRRPVMVVLNLLVGSCAFAIWRWKRWGFWGFIAVSLAGGVLKAILSPHHRGGLVFVLLGALLLYGVLRIGNSDRGGASSSNVAWAWGRRPEWRHQGVPRWSVCSLYSQLR